MNEDPALRQFVRFCLALLFLWPTLALAAPASTSSCRSLGEGTRIGDAIVLDAKAVAGGSFSTPDKREFKDLPGFCRVIATARPSSASNIVIEIWLPDAGDWNGKLLATGNGGFAGAVRYDALAGGIRRGYATANTDMGTYPASLPGIGYNAGNGRPEIQKDWGYRATHEMAKLAKKIVSTYYDRAASRAYYSGCSTGGHQGLTEAQQFPEDFDAILAGAPGHNRTHLHAMFADIKRKASRPGAYFTPGQFNAWHAAMLGACVGKDGGAPTDAFLTDPTQCLFSPRALICKPGEKSETCLTKAQADALASVYDGTRNPRTGALIYPPAVRGTEAMLAYAFTNPAMADQPEPADLSRWVFGPGWDPATFDFDKDMAREDQALGPYVNALDTDLSRFAAHGGKIILFHGWADMVVSPLDTIIYFDRMHASGMKKQQYARLFMAPGMSHCTSGKGPDVFGQGAEFPAADAGHDLLAALDRWVETGKAPDQVIARKFAVASHNGEEAAAEPSEPAEPRVTASRPLCAYPLVARYDGKGDPSQAASFTCSKAPSARYELPAPEYLRVWKRTDPAY
ncbi:tannase/feruloyl esterase family alpha/beta hydrolase [Novosphingobium malaysiense]|uniref:tannase/feruloyl esterase family alpha/beta hydrolase n=1 Tax=Novosphingobium malaysiense TaxID=1348853 RepID=UPI00068EAD9D|nr:tannase/feruloyl esterase family alpha/beta hydrolase [Novosphingobium malaysiense]